MFYLVGSRYFGTHREDSDHDYIGEDTPENRALLESMDFKRVLESKFIKYHGFRVDIWLVQSIENSLFAREMAYLHHRESEKDVRHAYILECIKDREEIDYAC